LRVGIDRYTHNPITNPMSKNIQNPYIRNELMRATDNEQKKKHLVQSRLKFYGL